MKRKIVSIRLNVAEATTEFVQAFNPLAWDNAYRPSDQEIVRLANLLKIIFTNDNWIEQCLYKKQKGYRAAAMTGFIANYAINNQSDILLTIQANRLRIPGSDVWWNQFEKMIQLNLKISKSRKHQNNVMSISLWPWFVKQLSPPPISFVEKTLEGTSLLGEFPKTLWRYTVRGAADFSVGFRDGVSNLLWFLKKENDN